MSHSSKSFSQAVLNGRGSTISKNPAKGDLGIGEDLLAATRVFG